jgi:hypothetical protein
MEIPKNEITVVFINPYDRISWAAASQDTHFKESYNF